MYFRGSNISRLRERGGIIIVTAQRRMASEMAGPKSFATL